jgi:hypothetical protein
LFFGVCVYIFRTASAEQLLIVQQQLDEIMLVSWQPQGTDTAKREMFYSDYNALIETSRQLSGWR